MLRRPRKLGDAASSHMMALEIQAVGLSAICCALREDFARFVAIRRYLVAESQSPAGAASYALRVTFAAATNHKDRRSLCDDKALAATSASATQSVVDVGAGGSAPARTVRVLLVADVRSPTAWGWVDAVRSAGVVVIGADGRPWPERRTVSSSNQVSRAGMKQRLRSLATATSRRRKAAQRLRRALGPLQAPIRGLRLRRVVHRVQPDVVHGMRISYEAIAAAVA
jgi:hypothetical protein